MTNRRSFIATLAAAIVGPPAAAAIAPAIVQPEPGDAPPFLCAPTCEDFDEPYFAPAAAVIAAECERELGAYFQVGDRVTIAGVPGTLEVIHTNPRVTFRPLPPPAGDFYERLREINREYDADFTK